MKEVMKSVCCQIEEVCYICKLFIIHRIFFIQGHYHYSHKKNKEWVESRGGWKSKPLALTKGHHKIDSSLLDIQVCAEETGDNSTLQYGVYYPK